MGKGAASLVALVVATQERFAGASLSLSLRQEEKGGWTLSGSGITRTGLSLTFGGAADLRADQAAASVAKLWFFETDGKRIVNTSLSDAIKMALNQKMEAVGVDSDLRVVKNGNVVTFTAERADGASLKWSGKTQSGDRLEAGHWVAWTQNEILSIDGESVDPRLNAMWTGEGARAIADVSLNETKGGLSVSVVGYRGDGARVEMIADVKTLDGFARAVGADGALLGMTFFESGEWSTRMIRETGGAEFQVFVHLKDGTSENSGRIRDVTTSLGDRTLHHYAGWLNKGVSKEARSLTAELFKSLGVGWSGSGGMAAIYENGSSVGFGLIGKDGNLTAAYLSDAKRFYVMTSGGLRTVGYMTAVNGISVAVIHGKLTNALGVLATAAGAKFISNGGPVNIWKGPNGEIHGALGTRLFIYGKGGFTALRVYENGGRLYVEGSFSRTTFQRVQSDGTVINVNVRQGTYAVMGGNGGISFKNEFSVNYGGVVGKLSDLPAGTVLRVELMGKLVSVTLGAPGTGLVRAIQDVTMAGPGGTKIIVREIGVGVKASGAAGAGVDPRTITNGALVPTAFGTVSSNGKVTAEFKTGADGQIRMVGLDLRTWNVGGETLALWLGGEFKTVTLSGVSPSADGSLMTLSFDRPLMLSKWGNIDMAVLTGLTFTNKDGGAALVGASEWTLVGFNGWGRLNERGTLLPVVFNNGKMELLNPESAKIRGLFETASGQKTLEYVVKEVVSFDGLTGQVSVRARLTLDNAALDIPRMAGKPGAALAADKPVDVMVQSTMTSDRYQSQVGKNGSMDVVMPVLSQREGEAAPVMKSKDILPLIRVKDAEVMAGPAGWVVDGLKLGFGDTARFGAGGRLADVLFSSPESYGRFVSGNGFKDAVGAKEIQLSVSAYLQAKTGAGDPGRYLIHLNARGEAVGGMEFGSAGARAYVSKAGPEDTGAFHLMAMDGRGSITDFVRIENTTGWVGSTVLGREANYAVDGDSWMRFEGNRIVEGSRWNGDAFQAKAESGGAWGLFESWVGSIDRLAEGNNRLGMAGLREGVELSLDAQGRITFMGVRPDGVLETAALWFDDNVVRFDALGHKGAMVVSYRNEEGLNVRAVAGEGGIAYVMSRPGLADVRLGEHQFRSTILRENGDRNTLMVFEQTMEGDAAIRPMNAMGLRSMVVQQDAAGQITGIVSSNVLMAEVRDGATKKTGDLIGFIDTKGFVIKAFADGRGLTVGELALDDNGKIVSIKNLRTYDDNGLIEGRSVGNFKVGDQIELREGERVFTGLMEYTGTNGNYDIGTIETGTFNEPGVLSFREAGEIKGLGGVVTSDYKLGFWDKSLIWAGDNWIEAAVTAVAMVGAYVLTSYVSIPATAGWLLLGARAAGQMITLGGNAWVAAGTAGIAAWTTTGSVKDYAQGKISGDQLTEDLAWNAALLLAPGVLFKLLPWVGGATIGALSHFTKYGDDVAGYLSSTGVLGNRFGLWLSGARGLDDLTKMGFFAGDAAAIESRLLSFGFQSMDDVARFAGATMTQTVPLLRGLGASSGGVFDIASMGWATRATRAAALTVNWIVNPASTRGLERAALYVGAGELSWVRTIVGTMGNLNPVFAILTRGALPLARNYAVWGFEGSLFGIDLSNPGLLGPQPGTTSRTIMNIVTLAPFLRMGLLPGQGVREIQATLGQNIGAWMGKVATAWNTQGLGAATRELLATPGLVSFIQKLGEIRNVPITVAGLWDGTKAGLAVIGRELVQGTVRAAYISADMALMNLGLGAIGGAVLTARDMDSITILGMFHVRPFESVADGARGLEKELTHQLNDPMTLLFATGVAVFQPILGGVLRNLPGIGNVFRIGQEGILVMGGRWAEGRLARAIGFFEEEALYEQYLVEPLLTNHMAKAIGWAGFTDPVIGEVLQELTDKRGAFLSNQRDSKAHGEAKANLLQTLSSYESGGGATLADVQSRFEAFAQQPAVQQSLNGGVLPNIQEVITVAEGRARGADRYSGRWNTQESVVTAVMAEALALEYGLSGGRTLEELVGEEFNTALKGFEERFDYMESAARVMTLVPAVLEGVSAAQSLSGVDLMARVGNRVTDFAGESKTLLALVSYARQAVSAHSEDPAARGFVEKVAGVFAGVPAPVMGANSGAMALEIAGFFNGVVEQRDSLEMTYGQIRTFAGAVFASLGSLVGGGATFTEAETKALSRALTRTVRLADEVGGIIVPMAAGTVALNGDLLKALEPKALGVVLKAADRLDDRTVKAVEAGLRGNGRQSLGRDAYRTGAAALALLEGGVNPSRFDAIEAVLGAEIFNSPRLDGAKAYGAALGQRIGLLNGELSDSRKVKRLADVDFLFAGGAVAAAGLNRLVNESGWLLRGARGVEKSLNFVLAAAGGINLAALFGVLSLTAPVSMALFGMGMLGMWGKFQPGFLSGLAQRLSPTPTGFGKSVLDVASVLSAPMSATEQTSPTVTRDARLARLVLRAPESAGAIAKVMDVLGIEKSGVVDQLVPILNDLDKGLRQVEKELNTQLTAKNLKIVSEIKRPKYDRTDWKGLWDKRLSGLEEKASTARGQMSDFEKIFGPFGVNGNRIYGELSTRLSAIETQLKERRQQLAAIPDLQRSDKKTAAGRDATPPAMPRETKLAQAVREALGRAPGQQGVPVDIDSLLASAAKGQRRSGQTDVAEPGIELTKMTFVQLHDHLVDLGEQLKDIVKKGGRFGPVYQRVVDVTNELNRRIQEKEARQSDKILDARTRDLVQREIGAIVLAAVKPTAILSSILARGETQERMKEALGALAGLNKALKDVSEETKGALRPDVGPATERESAAGPVPGADVEKVEVPTAEPTEVPEPVGPGARATLSEAGQLWMGVGSFGLGGGAVVGMAVAGLTLWAAPLAAAGLMSSAYFLGQWGRERSLDRAQGAGVTAWVEGDRVRVTWERFAGLMGSNWMGWLNPIGAWNRDVMALGVMRHELAHRDLGAGEFGAALAQVMPTFVSFAYGTVRALSNVAAGRAWNDGLASLSGATAERMLAELRGTDGKAGVLTLRGGGVTPAKRGLWGRMMAALGLGAAVGTATAAKQPWRRRRPSKAVLGRTRRGAGGRADGDGGAGGANGVWRCGGVGGDDGTAGRDAGARAQRGDQRDAGKAGVQFDGRDDEPAAQLGGGDDGRPDVPPDRGPRGLAGGGLPCDGGGNDRARGGDGGRRDHGDDGDGGRGGDAGDPEWGKD
ncbi:MAG: hypothetical protein IPL82_06485 [Elusimicrobia bacterium]|nr:hypothetical protein [Elusimicrobiota bacterium]